jgi:hypothetical protein
MARKEPPERRLQARLPAPLFGDARHEHLQLNEISLWTGDENDTGSYQNLADLFFDLSHGAEQSYRRRLDISSAVHTIQYRADGIDYTREYFASAPQQVLVFRFTADKPGAYTGTLKLTDAHAAATLAAGNLLTAGGQLANGLRYETAVQVLHSGGRATASADGTLHIENADALTILVAAGTNYSPYTRSSPCSIPSKSTFASAFHAHIQDSLRHRSGGSHRAAAAERFRRNGRAGGLPAGQTVAAGAPEDRGGTGGGDRPDPRRGGLEVAGNGYINIRLDRGAYGAALLRGEAIRRRRRGTRRSSSSTPTSIPTRRRTSGTCATPRWATPSCACCARAGSASRCRTTSTTPACRWPTWWWASTTWKQDAWPM